MKRTILACVIAATLLSGCGPKELTPEQKQEVSNLKSELSQTEKEIAAATEQQGQFTGGLIKNLTTARLEVLGTNKALLEQRINAIESGAKIDLAISGVKPDPEAAAALKTEIDKLALQISDAKRSKPIQRWSRPGAETVDCCDSGTDNGDATTAVPFGDVWIGRG